MVVERVPLTCMPDAVPDHVPVSDPWKGLCALVEGGAVVAVVVGGVLVGIGVVVGVGVGVGVDVMGNGDVGAVVGEVVVFVCVAQDVNISANTMIQLKTRTKILLFIFSCPLNYHCTNIGITTCV